MKTASLIFASILFVHSSALAVCYGNSPQNFVLAGHILTRNPRSGARFNIKLYPRKSSGRAVLLTTSDGSGNFRFTGLSASSYLLEVYAGSTLVNQQVVAINGDKEITIDLR